MPSPDAIAVSDLSVIFGEGAARNVAVDRASFTVPKGGSFGLVGESGSGKSTVLRAIAGLIGDWTGGIAINGEKLGHRRDRWLTFQRELPTYGAHVAVEVRDGQLVQTSDRVPDVLGIRRGEILESPRGWFVTYDIVHMGTQPTARAVNTRKASAWLPADAMSPPAPRDAFAAAVASAFRVVRR